MATGSVLDVEVLYPGPAVLAVPAEAGVAPSAPSKNLGIQLAVNCLSYNWLITCRYIRDRVKGGFPT